MSIMLITCLLALTMLTVAPPRSTAIEAELAHIKFINRYGYAPALVSREQEKHSQLETMTFYPGGISLESWQKRQEDIQDALNMTYVEAPRYANHKRYYIILTVIPGIGAPREEDLHDDDLCL